MNWQLITEIIVLSSAFIWLVWDLVAFFRGGPKATESNFIQTLAAKYPSVPFCFGVLMGHFFF